MKYLLELQKIIDGIEIIFKGGYAIAALLVMLYAFIKFLGGGK